MNGIGPGALSLTALTLDQCPPTPPPFIDSHASSDWCPTNPSTVSGTYDKKQEIGSPLTFSPLIVEFDKMGEENINQPLDT